MSNCNSSKQFIKNYSTNLDKINEMIEFPKLYLIDYFDSARAKVDAEFVLKLKQINDLNLRDKTNKRWIKCIEIIDKCQAKCLNNYILNKISAIEKFSQDKILRIKSNLESHLLQNDSFGVILNIQKEAERLVLIEEGLNKSEIEFIKLMLSKMNIHFEFEIKNNPNINFIKMKYITDELLKCDESIIFIESFPSVTELDISYKSRSNKSINLFSDSFKGFTNLIRLSLYFNVMIIEKECFKSLTSLKELNLSSCQIKYLFEDEFVGLVNLEKLDLSSNFLDFIFEGSFNGLVNLKELNLNECCLKIINRKCFSGLNRLEMLSLDGNFDLKVESESFLDLTHLKTLSIKNGIKIEFNDLVIFKFCINENTFDGGLVNLKDVSLSGCGFKNLRKNKFSKLNNLETLDLSCNLNIKLEEGCFNGLSRLKELNLSYCNIISLKENTFVGLNSLELINLSGNRNINLELNAFKSFKSTLKYLLFIECNLKVLKKDSFIGFDNLESLNLTENYSLEFEKDCFNGLKNLKELSLSCFCISELKENLFIGLDCLKKVYLHNNNNDEIDLNLVCFNGLNNLKILYLPNEVEDDGYDILI